MKKSTYDISQSVLTKIIKEEIEKAIEEGFLQDLGSKASNVMKGLAIAAAIGGASPAAAAPAGRLQHTETPIVSARHVDAVAIALAKKINDAKFKDRFGLDLRADPNDPNIEKLAKTITELYNHHSHGDQTIELYTQKVFEVMETTLRSKSPAWQVYNYTNTVLRKKFKKKKKTKKRLTVTKTTFRNNPILIQQAVLGIFLDANAGKSIKPALKNLRNALKHGIRSKDITREDASRIFTALKKKPSVAMSEINKILKLNK